MKCRDEIHFWNYNLSMPATETCECGAKKMPVTSKESPMIRTDNSKVIHDLESMIAAREKQIKELEAEVAMLRGDGAELAKCRCKAHGE